MVRKVIRRIVTDYVSDCDLIIAPSQNVLRLLDDYGVSRPVQVIPTPVRLDAFGRGEGEWVRKKHDLGAGERVLAPLGAGLLYVGRLAMEKDLPFLLRAPLGAGRAFRLVLAEESGCKLMLVGSGPEEKRLRWQVLELGIGGEVVFAGYVEHIQVPDYLAAADLFVFASRSEVQPLSVLEALAAGLPSVAVRTWATEDLLAPGVDSVLTEHDETAFAAEVVRLLRDDVERYALAQQARRTAQRYSIEATTEKLEKAYERARREKPAA